MRTLRNKRSFTILTVVAVIVALTMANLTALEKSAAFAAQKPQIGQVNFRWFRSAQIRDGKSEQAMQFATEVSEYVSKKHPEISVRPYMEVFGIAGKVYWFVDYDSLASSERVMSQLMSDQQYKEILKKAEGLFIEGKTHDTMMMVIR